MTLQSPDWRYRLVGLGGYTVGVRQDLTDEHPVVLGRHSSCTISITGGSEAADADALSRFHAVVERTPDQGWSICDSDSTNGTALLRHGVPPTIQLEPARHYPLEPGDIIELAGSADYQFVFQAVRDDPTPASGTQLLLRSSVRSVQQLVDGHAVAVREVAAPGIDICRAPTGGLWLASHGDASHGALYFGISREGVTVEATIPGFQLNQAALIPGRAVRVRDKDLVTSDGEAGTAFLFLDPDAVEPRRLSDLLLGADRVTFGTADDNICKLGDPSVSRHHAVIWRDGSELRVRDLGSANGTVVNERRVFDESVLREGNRLWIGRLPFIVDSASCQTSQPPEPSIDIRFVKVSVEIAGKLRLRQVSFGVRQGEMVGVLGPSASGKSTLLRALAGQQPMAEGDIYVNGRSVGRGNDARQWFKGLLGFGPDTREVGFVQQIDLLQPDLTVREILQFAARHMGLSVADARTRADHAGSLCNLGTLLERVAISGNGQMNLSGGQLKRVCVALEVLRQPRVLVLDEPTTGQDPKNTNDLMNLFRRLAQEGVTLLMSTHDLRNLILFDKVVAVCLGYLAYFGPPEGFAPHFGAATAEEVYESLPDREDRVPEAVQLAEAFRATPLYLKHCGVDE